MPLRPNSGLLLRYWCRKDKAFCERLLTLYRQQSEKDKQHDDLPPMKKFYQRPWWAVVQLSGWQVSVDSCPGTFKPALPHDCAF